MKTIHFLINLGVRGTDSIFSRRLKKAVNILTFNAIACIITAFCIELIVNSEGPTDFDVLYGLPLYILVLILNIKNKAYIAITLLFSFSAIMLGFFSLKTGPNAFTHSLYILNIIGVSLIYRKESPKIYFYFNIIFTLVCFAFVIYSFQSGLYKFVYDYSQDTESLRSTNLIFLIVCSIVFSIVVIVTNNRQYTEMEVALKEQKVLLAELHHRVKNNLSVIVGLLNLKKRVTKNPVSAAALDDIRDRVMSMALVHQMMYQSDAKSDINFSEYCERLVQEISKSQMIANEVDIQTEIPTLQIDVSAAIPLGLILNELFTNSFKHAFDDTKDPLIQLEMRQTEHKIHLKYMDNGKGLSEDYANKDSLGLNLIQGLTEQLDGKCHFNTKGSFSFTLDFKKK